VDFNSRNYRRGRIFFKILRGKLGRFIDFSIKTHTKYSSIKISTRSVAREGGRIGKFSGNNPKLNE